MPCSHRLRPGLALACILTCLASAPAHAQDPVIAAAGDIACSPTDPNFNSGDGVPDTGSQVGFCRQTHTSDLLVGAGLTRVLALGDTQYANGTAAEFQGSYDPSWGRVKSITRPVIGNHEYRADPDTGDTVGTGYWDYFNGVGVATGPAGERGKGYYSFDVGGWHLVALNSQCNRVPDGCGAGSDQAQWLRNDLVDHPASCTLAYWHHPQFHSGPNPNDFDLTAFWQALYDSGADLVLNGHRHSYERFAPQDPQGNADPQYGVREFIVGTGGHSHAEAEGPVKPNSQLRDRTRYGVLKLVLHSNGYSWQFVDENGVTFDSGSGTCHGAPDETPPQTTITSGPTGTTTATSATFSFSSSETGSTFECRLDGGGWGSCTSPRAYTGIGTGSHTFDVRAIDAADNVDPTPASRTWSVEQTAPDPSTPPPEEPSPADSPDVVPLGSTVFRPASYEILTGSVYRNRGGIRRLYRNDGRRLELAAGQNRYGRYLSAFEVLTKVDAGGLATLRALRLDFAGGTSARSAEFVVRVFNFRTRRWVRAYGPRGGRRERSFDWSVSAFAGDYLSSRGNFRIRVKAKGPDAFRTRTDLVRFAVEH